MVSITDLSIQFWGNTLFENVNLVINKKDCIALTGKNGAGKSTFLKILAGLQQPELGQIATPKEFTMCYLPQELFNTSTLAIKKEVKSALKELVGLENDFETIQNQIINATDYESDSYMNLLDKFQYVQDRLQIIGSHTIDAEIELVLYGLGFNEVSIMQSMHELSGGWRMRVELAKLLLQKPDLLLLDEPTNHLDIEAIDWLENYLQNYHGAIVLISHDRLFLDKLTNKTIEIANQKFTEYACNYSKHLILKQERKEQLTKELKNQEKYIEQTEKLIDQYRYKATKAAFAQQLIKRLDKLDRIEIEEDDVSNLRIQFPNAPHSGKVSATLTGLSKSYDEKIVLNKIDLIINRGEKIAIVGQNGQGKSTLIKLLVNKIEANKGIVEIGYQVSIGYFGQTDADDLDKNKTVFEIIDDVAQGDARLKIRAILGSFLFSSDDIQKKVKVLSGGEKTRLALAKLLLEPYNFLILDEPTNHLDMRSKDLLKKALLQYDGTLLIVSHDRDFLKSLTEKVIELKKGKLNEFLGDIDEYTSKRKLEQKNIIQRPATNSSVTKVVETESEIKISYQEKKEQEKRIRKIKNSITEMESAIEKIESSIQQMEQQLADPLQSDTIIRDIQFMRNYSSAKEKLQTTYANWEIANKELEEIVL